MAFKLADLVKETTVSDGTSNYDLTAVTGYQQFGDVLSDGDTTYYALTDGAGKWEVGIGTYDATNDELDRSDDDVIASTTAITEWSGVQVVRVYYLPSQKGGSVDGWRSGQVF